MSNRARCLRSNSLILFCFGLLLLSSSLLENSDNSSSSMSICSFHEVGVVLVAVVVLDGLVLMVSVAVVVELFVVIIVAEVVWSQEEWHLQHGNYRPTNQNVIVRRV